MTALREQPAKKSSRALYQVAFSRTQLGIKAAGTDARKFLKMLGFPAFSKTLA
jgi:hypothetical protein